MITVDSLSILNSLKIKEIGDTAYVNKEQKVYEYTEGGWTPKASRLYHNLERQMTSLS